MDFPVSVRSGHSAWAVALGSDPGAVAERAAFRGLMDDEERSVGGLGDVGLVLVLKVSWLGFRVVELGRVGDGAEGSA